MRCSQGRRGSCLHPVAGLVPEACSLQQRQQLVPEHWQAVCRRLGCAVAVILLAQDGQVYGGQCLCLRAQIAFSA